MVAESRKVTNCLEEEEKSIIVHAEPRVTFDSNGADAEDII
jgi:hypothetical protein